MHRLKMSNNRKLTLLTVLVTLWALIIWKTGLLNHLNLEVIQANQAWLQEQLTENFSLAVAMASIIYFVFVAMALPGIFMLALSCGYLFGATIGTSILVLVGGLGACVPYFLAQFLLSDWISKKFSKWIPKIKQELEKNPSLYMLAMRLNPVIPFMVQNTVPGFLGIPLKVYVLTTFIGLTPPSIAIATFGSGLNEIFTEGNEVSLTSIMNPQIITSLFLISFLIFIPLILRVVRASFLNKGK
jgi:uncharacterized membrane protein YdjX (TVP38/TMEM64 family)